MRNGTWASSTCYRAKKLHLQQRSPAPRRQLSPRVKKTVAAFISGLIAVGGIDIAWGQEAKPQQEDRGSRLEEIVVTAAKRETTIQDTPISVSAISGAELEAQGITSAEDAARQIPGVTLTSAGPGQAIYTIRGLASSGPAAATVGFYLDDIPMTPPTNAQNGTVMIDPNLYDLNRVEVLRGPQGTLYGAGSMGGTVKLVTNQPDVHSFSFSGKVDASKTDGGGFNHDENGMLNLPIIDGKLALRIVGTSEHTSGWIDRIVLADFPLSTNPQCPGFSGCTRGNVLSAPISAIHHGSNAEKLEGARAALRFQPTEDFSVTASVFSQNLSLDGLSTFDNPPGTEARYQPFDVPEPFSDRFRSYNLVAEYAFPAFTVTSVSSYWTRSQSQTQDGSETTQTLFGAPSFDVDAGGYGPITAYENDTTNQFSQEIRLASTGNARFQWLVGGFFSNYHYGQTQFAGGDGLNVPFGTSDLFSDSEKNRVRQTAAFGEASYNIVGGLTATAGLRRYAYNQEGVLVTGGLAAGNTGGVAQPYAAKDSGLNPKFGLSYDFNHDLLLYSTVAKGFRPGDGNFPVPTTGPASCLAALQAIGLTSAPTQYGPDTVWSYELGEKATLLDKRLTINSAVYYERWNDIQEQVPLPCGFAWIGNVGTASVKGGEVEINAKIGSSWTLTQAGSYTHAVVTAVGAGVPNLVDGQRLPNVPNYTASTSLVYQKPIGQFTLVARANNLIVGSSQMQTYALNTLPRYDIVKARVGILSDRWSAFLFVDNVTNKQAFLDATPNYLLSIPSLNRISTNQPRTIGLTFEFHY
jgi:iron complex outermembrane recepter protein